MLRVMLRPKWLAALGLVFVIATVFVLLSNWQFSRADENAEVIDPDFDSLKQLVELQRPNEPIQETVAAHRVQVSGSYATEPLIIVEGKGFQSLDTETFVSTDDASQAERDRVGLNGSWLVARFVAESASGNSAGTELAVVIGWAESTEVALDELANIALPEGELVLEGRFYPVEPVNTDVRIQEFLSDSGETIYGVSSVAPASLVNLWEGPLSAERYNGYLIGEFSYGQLREIETAAPVEEVHLNILNLFYAFEWIFFALFAGYIWFRLVKDEYEAEQEALAADEISTESAPTPTSADSNSEGQ